MLALCPPPAPALKEAAGLGSLLTSSPSQGQLSGLQGAVHTRSCSKRNPLTTLIDPAYPFAWNLCLMVEERAWNKSWETLLPQFGESGSHLEKRWAPAKHLITQSHDAQEDTWLSSERLVETLALKIAPGGGALL